MEISERRQRWKKFNILTPEKLALAHIVLDEIREGSDVMRALRTHPLENGEGYLTKAALVAAYNQMVEAGTIKPDQVLLERIRMKPMRTLSGGNDGHCFNQAISVPGQMYLLPH
ncbi:MAG: hypothetical protein IPJ46_22705 [Anaerolineales bacterium]|nr:hypothetical protein [Anaerolineales bacterium]